MRILVVEDNIPQVESLDLLLSVMGHAAYPARSVRAAKGVAEVHRPDAVVLDWVMPDASGADLITWLRSRPETAKVPVVVATGLPLERLGLLDGAPNVAVLQKPFKVEQLMEAIAEASKGA